MQLLRRSGHLARLTSALVIPLTLVVIAFFHNEYLIYWITLSKCSWPQSHVSNNTASLMLLADTHLLGSRKGHWFDKLRREWQQYQAYQTARWLFQPDYIVIMGDLTDEGKWCSDLEWAYYERRARDLFYADESRLLVVVGNHDVGFHYDMTEHKLKRFRKSFASKRQFIELNYPKKFARLNFVLANSMALENDGCSFCTRAQNDLKHVNDTLACLLEPNGSTRRVNCSSLISKDRAYSRPIIFTHYPLYRRSDDMCPHDEDSEKVNVPDISKRTNQYKENYDCLSKKATSQLLEMTNARLVFNGHSHYSCSNQAHGVPEFTLASFSWRNINTPSFLLLQVNETDYKLEKCYLPSESTVISIYIGVGILSFIYFSYRVLRKICTSFHFNRKHY